MHARTPAIIDPALDHHAMRRRAHFASWRRLFRSRWRTAIVAEKPRVNIICGPFMLDALGHRALRDFRSGHPEVRIALQSMTAALAAKQSTQRRADLLLVHRNVARQIPHRNTFTTEEIVSEPYAVRVPRDGGRLFHGMMGRDSR
jgi:hypothetical protein